MRQKEGAEGVRAEGGENWTGLGSLGVVFFCCLFKAISCRRLQTRGTSGSRERRRKNGGNFPVFQPPEELENCVWLGEERKKPSSCHPWTSPLPSFPSSSSFTLLLPRVLSRPGAGRGAVPPPAPAARTRRLVFGRLPSQTQPGAD